MRPNTYSNYLSLSPISKEQIAERIESYYKAVINPDFAIDLDDQIYFCYYLYQAVRYYQPTKVIQTGTFTGVSTIAMLIASFDNGIPLKISTIDPEPDHYYNTHNPVDIAREVIAYHKLDQHVDFIRGYSCAAPIKDDVPANVLQGMLPQYDMLVVDGDHSFHGAYGDLSNGMKTLKNANGIVLVHDYNGIEQVQAAVDLWYNQNFTHIQSAYKTESRCGLGIFEIKGNGQYKNGTSVNGKMHQQVQYS